MTSDKLLQSIGLCAKAGALIVGTPMICEALKASKKRICLILSASDNSDNTAKRLRDRSTHYGITLHILEVDGVRLGRAIGKSGHVAAVAVTDENLCRLVQKHLAQKQSEQSEDTSKDLLSSSTK